MKKRSKKLLLPGMRGQLEIDRVCEAANVFCFFFSKKKFFLSCLPPARRLDTPV
jgi:hypothetical protein